MSGDPGQEYFSDGLTEQIINGLCKVYNLFVIARNSSFAYKGKSVNVKQVAKELGVRYILEGSVQKAGDRVRITAQLIDATTGYHLWSENYDRDLSDIFALQDEITLKIMGALEITLTKGEQARLWYEKGGTTNIQAFDKLMKGVDCFHRVNEKDNKQARHFFKEAINIDNDSAMAYVMLGFTHLLDLSYGWSKSPIESFEQAEKNAEKALALNDSFDLAHGLLGWIYLYKRQYDEAIKAGEQAIELSPSGAEAHVNLGLTLVFSDKIESAIKLLERALRLNPFPQPYYYSNLAIAYRYNGQDENAIEMCKKALRGSPNNIIPYVILAGSYSSLNRIEEARKAVEEILRIHPRFTLERHANVLPFKNQKKLDKYIDALRKAGLPE
jgi:adenylate cyclase